MQTENLIFMKKLLLLAVLVLSFSAVMASTPPPFNSNSPDPIPVDGGAGLLLAAGAVYGAKKVRDMRKKKSEENNTPETEA